MSTRDIGVFLAIALFVFAVFYLIDHYSNESRARTIRMAAEYGYFEGQRECLASDVRIEKRDTAWHWKKSPWNNDTSKPLSQAHLYWNP